MKVDVGNIMKIISVGDYRLDLVYRPKDDKSEPLVNSIIFPTLDCKREYQEKWENAIQALPPAPTKSKELWRE